MTESFARLIPDIQPSLEEYDGVIIRDLKATPAAWVRAGQLIVHPHQIVPGLGELRAI